MRRLAALLFASVLAACAPAAQRDAVTAPPCDTIELNGELNATECQVQAAGQTLLVAYDAPAAGTTFGDVRIDVLGEDGAVVQTLVEPEVAEYRPVTIADIDGDGRADIQIHRESGNVNAVSAIWIFNGEDGRYERVGHVSGVEIARTGDGYIAVPARSSAAAWNVVFYRLDEGGLHPMITVEIVGEQRGGAIRSTCRVTEAPGLRDLNLTEREAEQKFCAEPAAQVFAP